MPCPMPRRLSWPAIQNRGLEQAQRCQQLDSSSVDLVVPGKSFQNCHLVAVLLTEIFRQWAVYPDCPRVDIQGSVPVCVDVPLERHRRTSIFLRTNTGGDYVHASSPLTQHNSHLYQHVVQDELQLTVKKYLAIIHNY